jgi:hypothetical protein
MNVPIDFSQRPASAQWEPLPIARIPGMCLWAWYRPANVPNGFTVSIPAEVSAACPTGFPFSMADLLMAGRITLNQLHSVSVFGGIWQPANTFGPFLNLAVPAIVPGSLPELSIAVLEYPAEAPASAPQFFGLPADNSDVAQMELTLGDDDGSTASMYRRIDASWKATIQMERQMTGLRAKLASMVATLGKLDRELSPEERLASDREDRDAWQDARRWLRDLTTKCHRELKSFDIGATSGAGKRSWMEQIYQSVIEPRTPTDELESYSREFETYRKNMVTLQIAMNTALQGAGMNGTQRAQRVLSAIGRKVRAKRSKK